MPSLHILGIRVGYKFLFKTDTFVKLSLIFLPRIHPRFKQDIAARLSLAARNVAYGESSVKSGGPFPTGYHVDSQTQNLTVTYASGGDFIQMKRDDGFEVDILTHLC